MPAQRSAPSHQQRPTLRAVIALGAVGLLLMTAPRIDAWVRTQFAERLAARAAASPGGEARLIVRRLADAGPETLGALVGLAGSTSVAADAARDAVQNRLTAWELDVRVSGDERAFARQLQQLSAALAASAPRFDAAGRAWAQRVALRIVAQADRLSGGALLGVLANCDAVISGPRSTSSGAAASVTSSTAARPVAATRIPTAAPARSTAAPIAEAPAADAGSAAADLQVVDQPLPPIAEAAPAATSIVAPPQAPREASVSPRARPLPPPDPSASVVDVPTPQQSRRLLRRYRQMSDRELSARLAATSGYELLAIQQVLRERRLPTAARPTAPGAGAASSRLFERVGKLPAGAARNLLRELVADETETPETRLEALTLLATSGDPQLAGIARRRALEDADPRVADLATQILRDVR